MPFLLQFPSCSKDELKYKFSSGYRLTTPPNLFKGIFFTDKESKKIKL